MNVSDYTEIVRGMSDGRAFLHRCAVENRATLHVMASTDPGSLTCLACHGRAARQQKSRASAIGFTLVRRVSA